MDVVKDFVRGAVCVHVLHHASEMEIHGAWMAQELARHGYPISPGTLYPLLHRLESVGLLESRSETVAGRARRVYTCTPNGYVALQHLRRAVCELANEVLPAGHDASTPSQPRPDRRRRQERADQR